MFKKFICILAVLLCGCMKTAVFVDVTEEDALLTINVKANASEVQNLSASDIAQNIKSELINAVNDSSVLVEEFEETDLNKNQWGGASIKNMSLVGQKGVTLEKKNHELVLELDIREMEIYQKLSELSGGAEAGYATLMIDMPDVATTSFGKAEGNKVELDLVEYLSSEEKPVVVSCPLESAEDSVTEPETKHNSNKGLLYGGAAVVCLGLVVLFIKKK